MSLTERIAKGPQDSPTGDATAPRNGSLYASTVDMSPTPDGYAAIAATFARSVIDDVKRSRQHDASALLVNALEIAFYLGSIASDNALRGGGPASALRDRMTVRISTYLPR